MNNQNNSIFNSTVLGHPQGLFILFFTEMWERFSYYGMRSLLIIFLISSYGNGGWNWSIASASALYGTYISLVYLTPILGGFLADKYLGSRKAVIIGTVIMTIGHASMALEFNHIFLYIGLGCLIIGNGFFKPNITSIISNMYKSFPEKKDGAYTIFYMGVNAGSFLGMMLCGYLGEKLGWSYGFGLAGIFMFLGMLQFYFSQKIFGDIGLKPKKAIEKENKLEFEGDRLNPFTKIDRTLIFLCLAIGLIWIINDPIKKVAEINFLQIGSFDFSGYFILTGAILFLGLLTYRIIRYPKITKDRMWAIVIFASFTVLFNTSFEQAGGTMTIFAMQYTERVLTGTSAIVFMVIDMITTIVPILIISWVLFLLLKKTIKTYLLSGIILASSFIIVWLIVGWKINRELDTKTYLVEYKTVKDKVRNKETGKKEELTSIVKASTILKSNSKIVAETIKIKELDKIKIGTNVWLFDTDNNGSLKYISNEKAKSIEIDRKVEAKVLKLENKEVEIPATWFGILNSLFIIILAPIFSKIWGSKYNPAATVKYGLGLIFIGLGFGVLSIGSSGIVNGMDVVKVSSFWLVAAYFLHTIGELCISPVSLSYVSKLVPSRMIALMFGIWYIALAIGNKLSGTIGGQIEEIQKDYSLSYFFVLFTISLGIIGLIGILISPLVKKLMHGVK
jgi:POT family proton-dependent oligopeptide transporter